MRVQAVDGRSALFVNVDPNRGKGSWTFKVQRRQADGSWKRVDVYRTQGAREIRTLDLPKGTYRVVVKAQHGFAGRTSAKVTLRR